MSGLTEFLTARLDEDERDAQDALERGFGGWEWMADYGINYEARTHIVRWHPVRVLREIEAKRAIVALYEDQRRRRDAYRSPRARAVEDEQAAQDRRTQEARSRVVEDAALALATIYADHPDYREAMS